MGWGGEREYDWRENPRVRGWRGPRAGNRFRANPRDFARPLRLRSRAISRRPTAPPPFLVAGPDVSRDRYRMCRVTVIQIAHPPSPSSTRLPPPPCPYSFSLHPSLHPPLPLPLPLTAPAPSPPAPRPGSPAARRAAAAVGTPQSEPPRPAAADGQNGSGPAGGRNGSGPAGGQNGSGPAGGQNGSGPAGGQNGSGPAGGQNRSGRPSACPGRCAGHPSQAETGLARPRPAVYTASASGPKEPGQLVKMRASRPSEDQRDRRGGPGRTCASSSAKTPSRAMRFRSASAGAGAGAAAAVSSPSSDALPPRWPVIWRRHGHADSRAHGRTDRHRQTHAHARMRAHTCVCIYMRSVRGGGICGGGATAGPRSAGDSRP